MALSTSHFRMKSKLTFVISSEILTHGSPLILYSLMTLGRAKADDIVYSQPIKTPTTADATDHHIWQEFLSDAHV